jgi:hypothetical protein
LKTIKLESDVFNKFSEYLKGTFPDEYDDIVEIQVKYQTKKEKEIEEFNKSVERLNQIKQMISEGFDLNDIKEDSIGILKKKQADLKAEKKAIDDAEKKLAEEKKLKEKLAAEKLAEDKIKKKEIPNKKTLKAIKEVENGKVENYTDLT